jgi:hypothetical protein
MCRQLRMNPFRVFISLAELYSTPRESCADLVFAAAALPAFWRQTVTAAAAAAEFACISAACLCTMAYAKALILSTAKFRTSRSLLLALLVKDRRH